MVASAFSEFIETTNGLVLCFTAGSQELRRTLTSGMSDAAAGWVSTRASVESLQLNVHRYDVSDSAGLLEADVQVWEPARTRLTLPWNV